MPAPEVDQSQQIGGPLLTLVDLPVTGGLTFPVFGVLKCISKDSVVDLSLIFVILMSFKECIKVLLHLLGDVCLVKSQLSLMSCVDPVQNFV